MTPATRYPPIDTEMPRPRPSRRPAGLVLCAALSLTLGLAGCGPSVVIGAGAAAGNAAMQERGFVKTVGDTATEAKISANLANHSARLFVDVSAEVYEGRALLTGAVDKTDDRIEAVRIAWNVKGVREVINEIQVRDTSDLLDAARDKLITADLSTTMTLDKRIKSINYSIETVNGTVYLMGIAQNQAELDRVRNHARQIRYVRRIVSHVRIKDAEGGVG